MTGKCLLVVEDQALVRESMVMLLQIRIPDLRVVQAASLAQALEVLNSRADVDLVTLDLALPDSKGLSTLMQLRLTQRCPPVVVVSADDGPDQVNAAIEAGAASFVGKSADAETLTRAIAHILRGGVVVPSTMSLPGQTSYGAASNQVRESIQLLTDRQRDVLRLLLMGKPNKQISRELELSEATVKTHLQAAFRRLDVNSRTQAVIAMAKLGLTL